jgi:hypothetical protein
MTIASDIRRPAGARSFWLGMAAYLLPTFPIAFVWHLVLFEPNYHALQIYRADPIIPFGLASMMIQAIIFSWVFPRVFAGSRGSVLKNGLLYGLGAGLVMLDDHIGVGNDGPFCHGHSRRWRLQPNTRWPRSRTMFCSRPPSRPCNS